MSGGSIDVGVKLTAAVVGAVGPGDVRAFCRENNIGKSAFYKWRARYAAEGLAGLEERSRRPLRSPTQTSVDVEERVVRARKELDDVGSDNGAWSIRQRLLGEGVQVPSEATIWRILTRRGLVVPAPKKKPKQARVRFRWARANDLWQIDATHWQLADGATVEIVDIIDDHSRVLIAAVAVSTCTSAAAWSTFERGCLDWGIPTRVLSDNGLSFNGSRRGLRVLFETNLRLAGVSPITSTPGHPQTCGKVERHHQTLKKWLARQPAAVSLAELQSQLDVWVEHYNFTRPHRALNGRTPATVWATAEPAVPCGHTLGTTTSTEQNLTVNSAGNLRVNKYSIALGIAHANLPVSVFSYGNHYAVFHNQQPIRTLQIDPDRYHQPLKQRTEPNPRPPMPN